MKVYRKNFLTKMKKLKQKIAEEKDREAAKEYMKLHNFVLSCKYTTYYKAKPLVQRFLSGASSEQCSIYLNISHSNTRDQLRLISDKLFDIFGDDFFELFDDFKSNIKEIHKRLYVSDHVDCTSVDYMFVDFLNLLSAERVKQKGDFKAEECLEELKFLIRNSIPNIKSELKTLDPAKLSFLLGVLDGTAGTIDERFNFIKLLETKEEEEDDVFAELL